ncbi:MAG: 4Fe-4S binding protein [Synergistaceae bacterium]|nr:4Fe-4S binding protein [Synergistaceae bacterium]
MAAEEEYRMKKRFAEVDRNIYVSCGACANECPRGAIKIWKGCYAVVDKNLCVGCGICQRTCPAGCIAIVQTE